jgi:hypothetical protein
MGDVYSVVMKTKLKPNTKKTNLANLMRQWLKEAGSREENQINFCLAESRKIGIRPDTFSGICKIVLAFHQGESLTLKDGDFDVYASAFKATYSWLSVLEEFFYKISWALEDGSYMEVDRDSGRDYYKIFEGKAWERHHTR